MEAALTLSSSIFYNRSFIISTPRNLSSHRRFTSITSNALAVNYSSPISVFPAEACETVGGDTCFVDMFPEVKLERVANKTKVSSLEAIEMEYMDYTDSTTQGFGCLWMRLAKCWEKNSASINPNSWLSYGG